MQSNQKKSKITRLYIYTEVNLPFEFKLGSLTSTPTKAYTSGVGICSTIRGW